jgi:glutathione peroxidase
MLENKYKISLSEGNNMNIYDFKVKAINGDEVALDSYRNQVLLIVNTASKCGFTPQYEGLQALYEKYHNQGFTVLGFPCNQFAEQEPGDNAEVAKFCKLNYGITFPIFAKIDVRGATAHPLYQYLTSQMPFQGFDAKHPIAAKLMNVLEINFPEFLAGDSIKWNFTKFLIDRQGKVVARYEPTAVPAQLQTAIEECLG